jgi:hypothetical protein
VGTRTPWETIMLRHFSNESAECCKVLPRAKLKPSSILIAWLSGIVLMTFSRSAPRALQVKTLPSAPFEVQAEAGQVNVSCQHALTALRA